MHDKVWLGYGFRGGATHFISRYKDTATAGTHKDGMIRVSGVVWYTNLEIRKRHEDLILYRHYTPDDYPRYFNFDAIEVSKTEAIPCDWQGLMGVPITFLDKYNPDQFEIVGKSLDLADMKPVKERLGKQDGGPRFYVERDGKLVRLYERIVIRRRVK